MRLTSFWFGCALCLPMGTAHATCAVDSLDVKSGETVVRFAVEVVDTPQTRADGLMFRENMDAFGGMLFVYEGPARVSFWMKNTLIPLDMLFADQTGTVSRIHSNAVPGDLTPIPGGADIQFVLEVNGGTAETLGLEAGSVIRHPAISQADAAWPCDDE